MSNSVNYVVPAMSRASIREFACYVRNTLGVTTPRIDIVRFLDLVLPQIDKGFRLEVCERSEMGANHGLTIPWEKVIKIREDVFDRASQGVPRDRFTLAHELGHYTLHADEGYARKMADDSVPPFQKSEWQANAFAGEFLVDYRHVRPHASAEDIVQIFGVSQKVAEIQHAELTKVGVIRG